MLAHGAPRISNANRNSMKIPTCVVENKMTRSSAENAKENKTHHSADHMQYVHHHGLRNSNQTFTYAISASKTEIAHGDKTIRPYVTNPSMNALTIAQIVTP